MHSTKRNPVELSGETKIILNIASDALTDINGNPSDDEIIRNALMEFVIRRTREGSIRLGEL